MTKRLTDDEIEKIYNDVKADSLIPQIFPYRFARAIERAHGIGE